MNRSMSLPAISRIMREFEREAEIMDMKEEMMGDAVDEAMDDEEVGEEEEGDAILKEVLDEIGVGLGQQVSGACHATAILPLMRRSAACRCSSRRALVADGRAFGEDCRRRRRGGWRGAVGRRPERWSGRRCCAERRGRSAGAARQSAEGLSRLLPPAFFLGRVNGHLSSPAPPQGASSSLAHLPPLIRGNASVPATSCDAAAASDTAGSAHLTHIPRLRSSTSLFAGETRQRDWESRWVRRAARS